VGRAEREYGITVSPLPAGTAASKEYSLTELMVIAGAREIADGEMVFVGMRLPMLAYAVAKRTHAPNAIGLYDNGIIRMAGGAEPLRTVGDPSNVGGATQCGQTIDVMGYLQQGRVQVGFLGGAEVDRFGNVNTLWGSRGGETQRLPGSGGGCDIACLAQRSVVMIPHQRDRFRERVGHITSPGYGSGNGWRAAHRLPARTGPSAIISNLGIMRFGSDGEAFLASIHPGVQVEQVLAATGWTLRVADALLDTSGPSATELEAVRAVDPDHFWTR
jgi:glutaconate CoA-transferase subunit B